MVKRIPHDSVSPSEEIVICRFGGNEIPIDISGQVWAAPHRGVICTIDFDALGVSLGISEEAKPWMSTALVKRAPSFITDVATALRQLGAIVGREKSSMLELTIADWTRIWMRRDGRYFVLLRQLYEDVISRYPYDKSSTTLADTVATWKVSKRRQAGSDVLAWVPDKGAFIQGERRRLKDLVHNPPEAINDRELVALVSLSILMDTGCRGVEVLAITADGLTYDANNEFHYVWVPAKKSRSGEPALPHPISEDTAELIRTMSKRATIAQLQTQHNRLLVCANNAFVEIGELSLTQLYSMSESATKNLVSPRTLKQLKASPRRTRHDYATRQARDGASAVEIGAALGHKDDKSAKIYVDATGADFVKALAKVDGNLSGLLSDLASAYKTGRVARAGIEEVCLPKPGRSDVVGFCAFNADSACKLPRFYSCYGCVYFKPADSVAVHTLALTHVHELEQRWLEHADLKRWAERTTLFKQLREAIKRIIHAYGG